MKQSISIFWFRQDLRISDNPGLLEASRLGVVLPIYILDDLAPIPYKIGGATRIYLHYALEHLNESLDGKLNIYKGNPREILEQLCNQYDVIKIFWNRCYEPWYLKNDTLLEKDLRERNIHYSVSNRSYLWSPNEVTKDYGSYYKVFSAYKKKAYTIQPPRPCEIKPNLICINDLSNSTGLNDRHLKSQNAWEDKIKKYWSVGEKSAQEKLDSFIENALSGYKKGRDYPGANHTSGLSAHLHFGEISPHQIWESIRTKGQALSAPEDVEHFLSEIVWREFSSYLLYHFPGLPSDNFQSQFNDFPWKHNRDFFHAWKKGVTGYPIVDAGMRELWETGYMHNRVRMIVASFLVKNLMIHWHEGRDWFWDCLIDADLANNSSGWQWVAGSGVDASPYFRIFNPITQAEKFDEEGQYIRKFIPELAHMPNKYLFCPWEAPSAVLKAAGVILDRSYPLPIVDIKESRQKALSAYHTLRTGTHE